MQSSSQGTLPLVFSIIYTAAWCASFYGQIYENCKLKSVQGLNLDYLFLNITGYTFYTTYCSLGYFTDLKGTGTIQLADLIFVFHGVTMITIEIVQACIFKRGRNRITKYAIVITVILWVIILMELMLTLTGIVQYYEQWNPITVLGYGKLVISFVKYTPQAYWNYIRKSTVGWSNAGVLLDFTGGAFSLISGLLSQEKGVNIVKLILAIISLLYDVLFCVQHFILYRQRKEDPVENLNLIKKDEHETVSESQTNEQKA